MNMLISQVPAPHLEIQLQRNITKTPLKSKLFGKCFLVTGKILEENRVKRVEMDVTLDIDLKIYSQEIIKILELNCNTFSLLLIFLLYVNAILNICSYNIFYSCSGLVTKPCLTIATPWTVTCQPPLSLGFSRQEYWTTNIFV